MPGLNQLLTLLPHGRDFRFVDSVESASRPGLSLEALFDVPTGGQTLASHFPGFPVWPGVLLCEGMAQTACLLFIFLSMPGEGGKTAVASPTQSPAQSLVESLAESLVESPAQSLVESPAQSLVESPAPSPATGGVPLLLMIERARFLAPVLPGSRLTYRATMAPGSVMGAVRFRCTASLGGSVVADCVLTAASGVASGPLPYAGGTAALDSAENRK